MKSLTHTATRRAGDWLVAQMNPDGSLRGATSINEYYKAIYSLAIAGWPAEADQMLQFIERRFLKPDGDLDGTGCPWFELFRIYAHPWVVMAAVVRARFDIAGRMLNFLEGWHHDGGFYGKSERAEQELMTTGLVGLAMLWGGRIDAAKGVGGWFKRLWEAQPDVRTGLYFAWKPGDGLITKFPEEKAKQYWVNAGALKQQYYHYGIAAALLSSLAGVTGDRAWLDLARKYLHASRHCNQDVLDRPQSGKIGWGAAWTWRLSQDPADRALAEQVYTNLSAKQHAEGWWSHENIYTDNAPTAPQPALDLTGEFLGHLSWIESLPNDAPLQSGQ